MTNWGKLFMSAIIVGIVTVILGYIIGFFTKSMKRDSPVLCGDWNKNHIMEINLFLIGFFLTIIAELTGANKWYCLNTLPAVTF